MYTYIHTQVYMPACVYMCEFVCLMFLYYNKVITELTILSSCILINNNLALPISFNSNF